MAKKLPDKVETQIDKAGLLRRRHRFEPKLETDKKGRLVIKKAVVALGPKRGKVEYVDVVGRIWIKDRAHAEVPDHWDVQLDGGKRYFRVDLHGKLLP